jgi:hypothetical protein
MRLILVAIAAWMAGIIVHLALPYLLWQERFGVEDLLGIILMSSGYSLVVFLLIYLPGLFWLRKRLGGCTPASYFPLAAASILNIPVALVIGLLHNFGGAFSTGEALLFGFQFIVAGLVFGAGFVTVYKDRPVQKSATDFA